MDFQKICEDVVTGTEGALGCLAIDLDTGLVLASASPVDAAMDEAEIDSVLRCAVEMFRGAFIDRFMRSMLTDRTSVQGFVHEAQVTTDTRHLFMAAVPGRGNGALVLAAEKTLTLGLAWMAVHQAQERIVDSGLGAPVPEHSGRVPDAASSRQAGEGAGDGNRAPEPAAAAAPPVDPKPIPPPRDPKEKAGAEPIPNPLLANRRRAERLKAAASAAGSDASGKAEAQDASGKRPGLFRRRSNKKGRK